MDEQADYEVIASSYGDPRLSERNPYQRLPERSRWTAWEERRYQDGTIRRFESDVARWGMEFSYGKWREVAIKN